MYVVVVELQQWSVCCLCQDVKDHKDAKKIHEMKGSSMVLLEFDVVLTHFCRDLLE